MGLVLLARDLGAGVVAEGVESPRDLAAIRELGIDAAQGYLLAEPTTDRQAISRWIESPSAGAGDS